MEYEKLYGNIWMYQIKLGKKEKSPKHRHEFDHIHQVFDGKAIMRIWDNKKLLLETEVVRGEILKVPKLMYHQIEAIEDYVGNCIHALRNEAGEVIDNDFVFNKSEDLKDIS